MYIISDPMAADVVDYFNVQLDDRPITAVDPQLSGDESQKRLHWLLPPLDPGTHEVKVQPVNTWATGEWSDPFVFTSLGPPPKVSGLRLSPQSETF